MTTSFMIENFSVDKLRDKTKLNNSKVRGRALISTLNFVRQEFKEKGFEKLLSQLEIALQITLRKNIDPNEWYNVSDLIDVSLKICEIFYKNDLSKLEALGSYAGLTILSGFTGLKLKIASFEKSIEFIKSTIEWYYLPAVVHINKLDSKFIEIECEKLFDPSGALPYRFKGIIQAVLANKGLQNIKVSYVAHPTKEDTYSFQAIWSS